MHSGEDLSTQVVRNMESFPTSMAPLGTSSLMKYLKNGNKVVRDLTLNKKERAR
jgi:hypothetical protein